MAYFKLITDPLARDSGGKGEMRKGKIRFLFGAHEFITEALSTPNHGLRTYRLSSALPW